MFSLYVPARAQTADDLNFYTEEYPPYNFRGPDGRLQGISIDLLHEVLLKLKSAKTPDGIRLVPWDEAYNSLLNGKNVCTFGTTRSETREDLFKWAGPIVPSRTVVIAKKDSKTLKSNEDLKNYRVAVIKNDAGHHIARSLGVPENNFVVALKMDDLFNAMEDGTADFWVYEEAVVQWFLKSRSAINRYAVVAALGANDLSYAFSKDVPDTIVLQFQDAIDEIKSSSNYLDILARYTR